VERLVLPTMVEPLCADWDAALVTAVTLGFGRSRGAGQLRLLIPNS
jgi:hypothetical protein